MNNLSFLFDNIDYGAFIVALFALYFSYKGFLSSRGSIEIEMDKLLKDASAQTREAGLAVVEYEETAREKIESKENKSLTKEELFDILIKNDEVYKVKYGICKAVNQEYLNTYEEICNKYIDKKVDKKRFENNYKLPIKQLFDSGIFDKELNPQNSPYEGILYVFKELWPKEYEKFYSKANSETDTTQNPETNTTRH